MENKNGRGRTSWTRQNCLLDGPMRATMHYCAVLRDEWTAETGLGSEGNLQSLPWALVGSALMDAPMSSSKSFVSGRNGCIGPPSQYTTKKPHIEQLPSIASSVFYPGCNTSLTTDRL